MYEAAGDGATVTSSRSSPRPLAVTIVGWLYLAVGMASLVHHGARLRESPAGEVGWILGSATVALVAGAFLLRGADWARWLALAWMAFHVAVGALHSLTQTAVHTLVLLLLSLVLFRPDASAFFRARGRQS